MIDCTVARPQNDTRRAAVAVTVAAKPRRSSTASRIGSLVAVVVMMGAGV